jgi:MFS family permease
VLVDVVEPRLRGTAAGIQRTALDAGKVVGPIAVGGLIDAFGYRVAFVACAVVVAGSALVLRRLPETMPAPESASERERRHTVTVGHPAPE